MRVFFPHNFYGLWIHNGRVGQTAGINRPLLGGRHIQIILDGVEMVGCAVRTGAGVADAAHIGGAGDTGPKLARVKHGVACSPPSRGKKRRGVGGRSAHHSKSQHIVAIGNRHGVAGGGGGGGGGHSPLGILVGDFNASADQCLSR